MNPKLPKRIRLAGRRKASTIGVIFALFLGLIGLSAQPAAATTLGNISWAVSNNAAGATAVNYSYSFKTVTAGTITHIAFIVSSGTVAGTPTIVVNYGIGAGSVSAITSGTTFTYTVTSPVSVAVGIPIFIEFGGFTNPAAGSRTTSIETFISTSTPLDGPTPTPAIVFASTNTAKTIVVAQSTTLTLDTTSFQLAMDPSLPALADQTNTSNLTVLSNANSGYTLTVANSATGLQCTTCTGTPTIPQVSASMASAVAWPGAPANATGYTVTGTGVGDTGFAVNAAFASGASFSGYRSAGDVIALSTKGTGATANTVAVQDQTAIDYADSAGTYTDTVTYTLTPNYS